jgi:hypothetical protein
MQTASLPVVAPSCQPEAQTAVQEAVQEGLLCGAESATLQPAAHPDAHHGRKNSTSSGHWLPQMRDMHRFDWSCFVSDETGIARPL